MRLVNGVLVLERRMTAARNARPQPFESLRVALSNVEGGGSGAGMGPPSLDYRSGRSEQRRGTRATEPGHGAEPRLND